MKKNRSFSLDFFLSCFPPHFHSLPKKKKKPSAGFKSLFPSRTCPRFPGGGENTGLERGVGSKPTGCKNPFFSSFLSLLFFFWLVGLRDKREDCERGLTTQASSVFLAALPLSLSSFPLQLSSLYKSKPSTRRSSPRAPGSLPRRTTQRAPRQTRHRARPRRAAAPASGPRSA